MRHPYWLSWLLSKHLVLDIAVAADAVGVDRFIGSIHGWRARRRNFTFVALDAVDGSRMYLRPPPKKGYIRVTLLAYGWAAGGIVHEPEQGRKDYGSEDGPCHPPTPGCARIAKSSKFHRPPSSPMVTR